jgi:hypothetical protein
MKHDEAIKTIRDFVKIASKWGAPGTMETLAAIDQLNPEPSEDALIEVSPGVLLHKSRAAAEALFRDLVDGWVITSQNGIIDCIEKHLVVYAGQKVLAAIDQLATDPSEDAWGLARELAVLDESPYARCSDAYFNDAAALITAHDERIRREVIEAHESAKSKSEGDTSMKPWCVNGSDAVERWDRSCQPENAKLGIDTDAYRAAIARAEAAEKAADIANESARMAQVNAMISEMQADLDARPLVAALERIAKHDAQSYECEEICEIARAALAAEEKA